MIPWNALVFYMTFEHTGIFILYFEQTGILYYTLKALVFYTILWKHWYFYTVSSGLNILGF